MNGAWTLPQLTSEIISFLALGISLIALWQSMAARTSDLRINVGKVIAGTDGILRSLEDERAYLLEWTHSSLAADGMFNSGKRVLRDQSFDALKEEIPRLADQVAQAKYVVRDAKARDLELLSITFETTRLRVEEIAGEFREVRSELQGKVISRIRRAEDRATKGP